MVDTSKAGKEFRDLNYFRQRFRNRVFAKIAGFFANEAERAGIAKKDIADRLGRDPSQITRWLANPSNLTLDTISDLLFALDAEAEPPAIVKFADRVPANYAHPLIARATGVEVLAAPTPAMTTSGTVHVDGTGTAGTRPSAKSTVTVKAA